MKLVIQDRPLFGERYEDKLRRIRSMGFDGMEIDGDKLIGKFEEIKQAVQSTGIPITSVCGGYRGWIGDFDRQQRETAIADLEPILHKTAEIGAVGVVAPAAFGIFSRKLPPFIPQRTEAEDEEILLESLGRINKMARAAGTVLLLEPLNRYEDHMINRLEQAGHLIRTGGFTSVKIIADFFHMSIEEPDIPQSIRNAGDLIGHIHLSDSNRLQPGLGHTDFVAAFQALHEIGYDKYLSIECPFIGDPTVVYHESCNYLRRCLKMAVT